MWSKINGDFYFAELKYDNVLTKFWDRVELECTHFNFSVCNGFFRAYALDCSTIHALDLGDLPD